MRSPIVDVHIEKTAGRSKRQLLIDRWGSEQVLHYDCSTDKLVRAGGRLIVTEKPKQEKIQEIAKNRLLFPAVKCGYLLLKQLENRRGFSPEDMPPDFAVITGHLKGDRFEQLIPPEESTYTSVLRDPLARAYSHYQHWRRTRGLARFRVTPAFSPQTTFEEFALQPDLQNYQLTSLGINPERFSVLGVVSKITEYFEELGLQVPGTETPHRNKATYHENSHLDPGFVRDFRDLNSEDYELFTQVSEQWDAPTISNDITDMAA